MLRTNGYFSIIVLFFLIFVNPTLSRADSFSEDQSEKTDAVNQQLDSVENEFANAPHPDGVEKEFTNTTSSYAAVKESPNVRPAREDTGPMLKSFLSADEQPTNPQPKPPSNVKTRVHTFDTGAEIFHYHYQEPRFLATTGITTQDVKIRGPMYGYYFNYAYRPADPNFLNNFISNVYMLQARLASSHDLEYTGSGEVKDKHDTVDEFRGLIGKDYFIGKNARVTPYFGFGYRYLFDHGSGEFDGLGYDRKSHYYYLPLGGDLVIEAPNGWETDYNIEYDIFLHGVQKSYFVDSDPYTGYNNPDITNNQGRGYGIRASIKLLKHLSLVDFYVEPYIRIWDIEGSSLVAASINGLYSPTWNEPKNVTTEIGSRFGVQF